MPLRVLGFLCVCLVVSVPLAGQDASSSDEPLATLNGQPIYESELPVSAEQHKLHQRLYALQMQALGNLIANKLLEAAAEEAEQDIDGFVQSKIAHKVGVPTGKEVAAYYESQKDKINKPLREVRDQILQALTREKASTHLAELVASLRADSDLEIYLGPPRLSVSLEDVRSRGPADAPVTVVEFSDFQCPFCRRVQPVLAELSDKYGDDVRWVFKDLPLTEIHPEAMRAAQAARCAGEQGKFWEYRAKLFEQELFTDGMYTDLAKELKIKADPLMECLDSGKYESPVVAEAREAAGFGVEGTPAILINGILTSGARSVEYYDRIIQQELDSSSAE